MYTSDASLLEINQLHVDIGDRKGRKTRRVLENVSLSVRHGEKLGIVGESGCGKSMTALSIMGLLPRGTAISGGTISFRGKELTSMKEEGWESVRGREMAMIFQDPLSSLNPVLTIGEQLTEGIRLHLGLSRREARAHASAMLQKVGMARARQLLDEYPHRLSGGMRQRVMIAMALACSPKLLIADEPTTALDVTVQAQILELMKRLNETEGTAMILISHDLGVIAEMCDRVAVMYAGEIVEIGTVEQLFASPRHPYTVALMNARPRPDRKGSPLATIPGKVPAPGERDSGCSFRERCASAASACGSGESLLLPAGKGHEVRCLLVERRREELQVAYA
ncbi:ABC transporter ATP-binding protein [Paenibacillus chungangensis]|uniref:ABC transporter ATP-binding protein n=1 Tax=Paenibacillus chungangensis TaxID=696535 RepID=A0ABW3HML0_9BACL